MLACLRPSAPRRARLIRASDVPSYYTALVKIIASLLPLSKDGGSPQHARDRWRQKDLGVLRGEFQASVPPHGEVPVHLTAAD